MTLNKFLECVGSVLAVTGIYLIAFGYPVGWPISLAANVVFLLMSFRLMMPYLFFMNVAFLFANASGTYKNLIVAL